MPRLPLLAVLLSLSACDPTTPDTPDGGSPGSSFNGGFERLDAAGVPESWTSTCEWNGLVLVTTNAAASGQQGLRMYGGCTVTSSTVPAPASASSVLLTFSARTAASGAAVVTATWLNADGEPLSSVPTTIQATPDRAFRNYFITVPRPEGGASLVVSISTPDTSTVTADFDNVAMEAQ